MANATICGMVPLDDAPGRIVPYDPTWPAQFEAERDRLGAALAAWLNGPIEHIGSTAVAGLVAKSVIDIMAAVESLSASQEAILSLRDEGYVYAPYHADACYLKLTGIDSLYRELLGKT